MGPIIRSLIHLQKVEQNLRVNQALLENSQQSVKRLVHFVTQLQSSLTAKHEEIKLTRLQNSKYELDLKTEEEENSRLRVQLNTAKTNRDYSAILTKINTDKVDKTKLEDRILTLMSQVENDQVVCKEIESEIQDTEKKLDDLKIANEDKETKFRHDIQNLQSEKQEAFTQIPEQTRMHFVRLADRYDGEVLAQIVKKRMGRKIEHTCGGCFMSIPLELVNTLMTKDEVIPCPSCGRIIVLDLNSSQTSA